jgi:dienelactone hydrolase
MRVGRTIAIAIVSIMPLAAIGYLAGHDHFEAAAFIVRAANMHGIARRAANLESANVRVRSETIPWRAGQLRAKTYTPLKGRGTPVMLVPGVHAAGIEEPRLVGFAKEIAAAGHPVVTVELPDLMRYLITPRTTDMIEDAARWLSESWAPHQASGVRRIGLMGISFAGGLSVVAASRLDREHVQWVLSLGGHGDLPRTLHYLCTGQHPGGAARPPHDYGVVIILLGVADRMVPAEQVQPLRTAILAFLNASHLDMVDKPGAQTEFARAKALADALPEPARTYMNWVNTRDVGKLGPALVPHVGAIGWDAALSPSRSLPPTMPVYLLHGADDNVIPAAESVTLADELRRRGTDVELLVTPLITHAEVDRPPSAGEMWKLVRFWAGPL